MAKEKFQDYLKAGIVNRYTWETSDLDSYSLILDKLKKKVNGTDFERSIYNYNLVQHLEFPIALEYIKKQYPEISR